MVTGCQNRFSYKTIYRLLTFTNWIVPEATWWACCVLMAFSSNFEWLTLYGNSILSCGHEVHFWTSKQVRYVKSCQSSQKISALQNFPSKTLLLIMRTYCLLSALTITLLFTWHADRSTKGWTRCRLLCRHCVVCLVRHVPPSGSETWYI